MKKLFSHLTKQWLSASSTAVIILLITPLFIAAIPYILTFGHPATGYTHYAQFLESIRDTGWALFVIGFAVFCYKDFNKNEVK